MRRTRLLHAIRTGLWFTPLACVLAGAGVAAATTFVDRHWGPLVPQAVTGSSADVRQILGTIATSIVTLTGLVLTMTLVAVQLAIGEFSSRIVRPLLENHPSQLVIGIFGATLVQAVVALRAVDVVKGHIPGVYALMASSLVLLVLYSHEIGVTLRSSALIDTVGDRGRDLVQKWYPVHDEVEPPDDVIVAKRAGLVVKVLRERLVKEAREADCVFELLPMIGDFVPRDAPLFRIHGNGGGVDRSHVSRLVLLADERALKEDLGAAFRALVDVAERSLQQPFADPTTAVQAIHRLHDLLRQLARRDLGDGCTRDEDGVARLVERRRDWDAFVRLAFDEIRLAGKDSPQIPRRLRAALDDLKSVAPPERQAALDRQLALLDEAVPDVQGIGSGPDLTSQARRAAINGS
jgi:uncharacterized membrane protein